MFSNFIFVNMNFLFLLLGLVLSLNPVWQDIFVSNNLKCFRDIINKSTNEQISLRATLAVSPNYLLKRKNNKRISKLRVVSDACFR